jgi:hypothetical protein
MTVSGAILAIVLGVLSLLGLLYSYKDGYIYNKYGSKITIEESPGCFIIITIWIAIWAAMLIIFGIGRIIEGG